ncbi:MAG: GTP cyclohydrolase I FolE2, partial [Candidatus Latescibacteria bacterium]|nr:GTP cyclohydrolase I FolE2 [Candidatus Latescibacterota bacterium]
RDTEWIDRTGEILEKIRTSLEADEAHMEVEFPYFIEKKAPVSGQPSLMSYDCRFFASYQNGEDFILSVSVPVLTMCPCSKEISDYGAHNQRCTVTVQVRYNDFVWIEELIELAESSASGDLYSILKRPDEKYVTEHAYDNPMFVEDVVREVAHKLNEMDRITWYIVEADSQESIHNHNAYASVEKKK